MVSLQIRESRYVHVSLSSEIRADGKVIAATNRIDILDPALLRSGRLDRKIEFPLPNESAREGILQIHARKLNHKGVK